MDTLLSQKVPQKILKKIPPYTIWGILYGKSLDTVGKTVVDTAKDKLVLPHSFTGEFVANKKVDDGLPRLEVIHSIPGP